MPTVKRWNAERIVYAVLMVAAVYLVTPMLDGLWTKFASSRTATVREVTHRGYSEVYMNDGSVWLVAYDNPSILKGDAIRYVHDPTAADDCFLHDDTTGYEIVAYRISAPYKRSNCPAS